jgi:hypothetical protein
MECIICNNENESNSVEHIVSESLGNKDYIMQKGEICDACNGLFSKFEQKALGNSIFIMERARHGIASKRGKEARGQIKELQIQGDPEFRKQHISVKGLSPENFFEYNPENKTGKLIVESFDKSEIATAKLILKTAIEAIYKSRRELYSKYNFQELKDYLINKTNIDWPFLSTNKEITKFISVPRYYDKYRLGKIPCELKFFEVDSNTLLFKFKFGAIAILINLLNRNISWTEDIVEVDKNAMLYPLHYREKQAKNGKKVNR